MPAKKRTSPPPPPPSRRLLALRWGGALFVAAVLAFVALRRFEGDAQGIVWTTSLLLAAAALPFFTAGIGTSPRAKKTRRVGTILFAAAMLGQAAAYLMQRVGN